MNKYAAKIDKLRYDRGWSVYRLSQESGIPNQTISKWLYKNAMITIPMLSQICEAFGITLADFFAEGNLIEVTPEVKTLYGAWCSLTSDEKSSVKAIIKNYINKR